MRENINDTRSETEFASVKDSLNMYKTPSSETTLLPEIQIWRCSDMISLALYFNQRFIKGEEGSSFRNFQKKQDRFRFFP